MVTEGLCIAALDVTTADAAIRALARLLAAAGHVLPSFEAAALARERRSPTGLPFPGVAVALPHADPEHVRAPAIAIATLARAVRFRQMGAPERTLDVRIVVVPALTAAEQAAGALARVIEQLQDDALRDALLAAPDAAAIAARFASVASVASAPEVAR
ncbi:MAG: hypothetical protein NVSMB47_08760 [Polyangiales bacterium]